MRSKSSTVSELDNKVWLHTKYWEEELSDSEIASVLNVNSQRVRRARKRLGVPTRSRSEAQAIALKSGRSSHPTKGKNRTIEEKNKISEGMVKSWSSLSEEELKERSRISKENWDKMPEHKKNEMHKLAIEAVRKTAKDGSQLEKFVRDTLTKAGWNVKYHMKGLIPNSNLELDMFLPEVSVAIEIDGPSHFFPIWGEDSLRKNIRSDLEKTGLITNQGFVMIRIKQMNSFVSDFARRKLAKKIVEVVKGVSEKFPDRNNRVIEVEI